MSRNGIDAVGACRDRLIGDIYECVVDPARWPDTVARVIAGIGGVAGWVAVHRPDRVASSYQIEVGTDPLWQQRLRESYVPLSPYIGAAHYVSSGDLLTVEDVVDYGEFTRGRFYREWAAPQGWPDLLFAVLSREADAFSFLGVCLPARAEPRHKEAAAMLVLHLERALRILDMVDRSRRQLDDLEAAVGVMGTGVALITAEGAVQGINRSAERLLKPHLVEGPAGVRRLRWSAATGPLRDAVAASARRTLDQAGATLPLDAGARQLTVHLVPLPASRSAGGEKGAVAALFVTDPAEPPSLPPAAVVARYGLTPSELRVALALVEGHAPAAIAAQHGISLATVRTHLRRLYDKTGTEGQAPLVRAITSALQGV